MTRQQAWFEIFKAVIAAGEESSKSRSDYLLKVYEAAWMVLPERTVVWEYDRPLRNRVGVGS